MRRKLFNKLKSDLLGRLQYIQIPLKSKFSCAFQKFAGDSFPPSEIRSATRIQSRIPNIWFIHFSAVAEEWEKSQSLRRAPNGAWKCLKSAGELWILRCSCSNTKTDTHLGVKRVNSAFCNTHVRCKLTADRSIYQSWRRTAWVRLVRVWTQAVILDERAPPTRPHSYEKWSCVGMLKHQKPWEF